MDDTLLYLSFDNIKEYTQHLKELIKANDGTYKKILKILITNMPQKHILLLLVLKEIEPLLGAEELRREEIEILRESLNDYIVFSNVSSYLESRWTSGEVNQLYFKLMGDNCHMHRKLVRNNDKESVEAELSFEIDKLPMSTVERMLSVYREIERLSVESKVHSVRDVFLSYRICLLYEKDAFLCSKELLISYKIESIRIEDLLSGVFLGLLTEDLPPFYFYRLVINITRKDRNIIPTIVQILLEIDGSSTGDNVLLNKVRGMIPYLYSNIYEPRLGGVQKSIDTPYDDLRDDSFSSLLTILDRENAMVLYNLMDGRNLPRLPVFGDFVREKEGLSGRGAEVFEVLGRREGIEPGSVEVPVFIEAFVKITGSSPTHFYNYYNEYRSMFKSMSDDQITYFKEEIRRKRSYTYYTIVSQWL